MGSFLRANITDDNFIRGAARVLYADAGQAWPTKISDVVQLQTTATNEVQTLTVTGTPTGGDFRLQYKGYVTATIAHNASAANVASALIAAVPGLVTGDIVGGGGALPATPVTLTFAQNLAATNVDPVTVVLPAFTGGTNPAASVATTTPGQGQYEPQPGWKDLGATKTGVQISRNNAEESFDIDQIVGDIESAPTEWTMQVQTALAEVAPQNINFAWEGGTTYYSVDSGSPVNAVQSHTPLGMPETYVRRRLAIVHKRDNGKLRMYVFRRIQKAPQDSSLSYQKQGEQQSIPLTFRALADSTVSDPLARFGDIIDQT